MNATVCHTAYGLTESEESHWSRRSARVALLAASWAIFDLTSSATLTVILLCGKFGWNDLRTAFWLRRTDPDAVRGRVCATFYLASSLWKVSLAAVTTMFTVVFLAIAIRGCARREPPEEFAAAALLALIAPAAASLVTWLGIVAASRNAIKVWAEPTLHRARRAGAWPPHRSCRANQAGYFMIAAILCPAGPLLLAPVVIGFLFLEVGGNEALVPLTGIAISAIEILMARLALALKERVARRVVAIIPEECWGASRSCTDRPLS